MRNIHTLLFIAVAAIFASRASVGWCHGLQPIEVSPSGQKLVVGGGYDGAGGFAANVFADPDEEALMGPVPNNSAKLYTTLPGFTLNDLEVGSGLSLTAEPRRQLGDESGQPRWLWYWRQSTGLVEVAPNDPSFQVISAFDAVIDLRQYSATSNHVLLAEPTAADLSSHADLMRPLLDNSPTAPAGVYAIFARLTSPTYQASEPILLAVNVGLEDPEEFKTGALAIDRAAGLAADYDFDGDVDGADMLLWQRGLGGAGAVTGDGAAGGFDSADLAKWSSQFGQTSAPAVAVVSAVPEPGAVALALIAATMLRTRRR